MAPDAEETLPAGGVEGHDDLVAEREILHGGAEGDDFADEFVAADEVRRAFEVAPVEVQVAAAERRASYFEDGVGGVLKGGDGPVFDDDLWENGRVSWLGRNMLARKLAARE